MYMWQFELFNWTANAYFLIFSCFQNAFRFDNLIENEYPIIS